MKVLLVQTAFLGDCILATAAISAIQDLHPHCGLWILTTRIAEPLYRRIPGISGILILEKRSKQASLYGLLDFALRLRKLNFDITYSLHKSARTSFLLWMSKIPKRVGYKASKCSWLYTDTVPLPQSGHTVEKILALFKPYSPHKKLSSNLILVPPHEDEVSSVVRDAVSQTNMAPILIAPGSVWATKMWPSEYFRSVALELERLGYPIIVVGAPQEQAICDSVAHNIKGVNLCSHTSIDDLMWLITKAQLVICNDSSMLHFASALKTPSVSIFCATSPIMGFGPWKNRSEVIQYENLWCKPCRRHGSRKCPTGTELCMKGVLPSVVVKSALQLATTSVMTTSKEERLK